MGIDLRVQADMSLARRRLRAIEFSPMGQWLREWATGRVATFGDVRHTAAMSALRLLESPARWAHLLTAATFGGIVLGLIGPFGSFLNDGALMRVAYWTGLFWAGALVYGLSVPPAVRLAPRLGVPVYFAVGAAVMLATLPMAAFVAFVGKALWPAHVTTMTPLVWYGQTLLIGGLAVIGVIAWDRRRSGRLVAAAQGTQTPSSPQDAGFSIARPEGVLCLQMEDHYVRIHRAGGSELALAPLRDAIAALGERDGMQTHRSWWVARDAVARIDLGGREAMLRLTNGLSVPVARNRIANLRAAGWLAPAP